uniref:Uncharacterized protein n=1 Tax=Solanum lycopersicum TaxID=4081 RepID=A0A3Q7EDA1_SOLLC
MEEPTLKERNQWEALTLSPTLFSDDVPWAKGDESHLTVRKGDNILFLSSSNKEKWVGSFHPPIYAILCLRS